MNYSTFKFLYLKGEGRKLIVVVSNTTVSSGVGERIN
jgi:hypothetical protein